MLSWIFRTIFTFNFWLITVFLALVRTSIAWLTISGAWLRISVRKFVTKGANPRYSRFVVWLARFQPQIINGIAHIGYKLAHIAIRLIRYWSVRANPGYYVDKLAHTESAPRLFSSCRSWFKLIKTVLSCCWLSHCAKYWLLASV